jgi:uncharacterized protein (TIGR02145 family)
MKQKQRIVFLGMVAIALIFVACGGDSGNNSTEPEGDSSSSTTRSSSSSVGVLNSSSSSSIPSSSSVMPSSSSVTKDWFNAAISYGSLTDTRDNQTYKTVVIGAQTWMAENLNYTPSSGNSWCYNNLASNCATYGRLYDWSTVMAGSASSDINPSGVHGICPSGWHVPSSAEWTVLEVYVGASAGAQLKVNSSLWSTNTGTDAYGFSALPGGSYDGSVFYNVGNYGFWWSATAYSSTYAYYWIWATSALM